MSDIDSITKNYTQSYKNLREIVSFLPTDKDFAYGEAVRRVVKAKPIGSCQIDKIDIFSGGPGGIDPIIQKLRTNGYTIKQDDIQPDNPSSGYKDVFINASKNGVDIQVNFRIPKNGQITPYGDSGPPVDIYCIGMTKNINYIGMHGINVVDVSRNIGKDKYTPLQGFNDKIRAYLEKECNCTSTTNLPPLEIEVPKINQEKINSKVEEMKEKSMSNRSIRSRWEANLIEASYDTAAEQLVSFVRAALVKAIQKASGMSDDDSNTFMDVLKSPVGYVAIGLAIGESINHIPQLAKNPKMAKISDKILQKSMSYGMNSVVNEVMEFAKPFVEQIMSGLDGDIPVVTAVRVASLPEKQNTVPVDHAAEEEDLATLEQTNQKQMTAGV